MPKASRTPQSNSRTSPYLLINSAGIAGVPGQKTGNVDYESWAQVLNVNTMGPLRGLESFCDHIVGSERRLVVTITSGMGSLAEDASGGSIAYRSSKAAVNMVMRSAAIDLAPRGITCVLVNPGWVRTDMGGPKAPLSPQESVTAMWRLIDTFGQINRASSTTTTAVNIRGERSAAQSEPTGVDTIPESRPTPSDAIRTSLREKLNRSPLCRNGNWKIASRDRRPKPAPNGPKFQKLPARD
jgi:NAD(P)-dependent dehydrogenase (short-subunit alcohol dehydrogenase family)